MKKVCYRQLAVLLLFIILGVSAFGQITPSQDAYTDTAKSTTNFGAATTLGVVSSAASIQTTYLQFDLSSIPAGYISTNVAKATLKLYVNSVTTGGSFNVDFVNGSWTEKTITASLEPALGSSIASSVSLSTANVHDYVLIDVTTAVGDWLNGSQPNDGIALVANSPLSATLDSKENTSQSHPAELDIVFTSGGTITGVSTASGSGLTGGGTSGTLSLSLQKTCSNNQVLQWNGSAWVCASAGTGTITGVTAGTALTGGGNSGSVTLNLDTTKVPQLNAANIFSGNQQISGNLTASASTGITVSGTSQTGYGVYGQSNSSYGMFGSSQTGNGVNGASISGGGVVGNSQSNSGVIGASSGSSVAGVFGYNDSSSTAIGVEGESQGGSGVYGQTATGYGVWGQGQGTGLGVYGYSYFSTGVYGLSKGNNSAGVFGQNDTPALSAAGVYGESGTGNGVYGQTSTGYGVWGNSQGTSGSGVGVYGSSQSSGAGVYGQNDSSVSSVGVQGESATGYAMFATSQGGLGLYAYSGASGLPAVYAEDDNGTSSMGVEGVSLSGNGVSGLSSTGAGVVGQSTSGIGIYGQSSANGSAGIFGMDDGGPTASGVEGDSVSGYGVFGESVSGYGVYGFSSQSTAVYGVSNGWFGGYFSGAGGGDGLHATTTGGGYAGSFNGNLDVTGTITAGGKDFKIDHPLDPANQYLYHASVESSEMKNIYDGMVTLDASGEAVVELPNWFEALNGDFRYQLTAVGAPASGLYIADEIHNHRFKIAGGRPNVKISWQVTGTRRDAFAKAYPLQVEVAKPANERGYYIHPEFYGASAERQIEWARNPEQMKRTKQLRENPMHTPAKPQLAQAHTSPERSPMPKVSPPKAPTPRVPGNIGKPASRISVVKP